ncbi:MAG: glycosyltransferase family 4 protein [Pseudomonadota bacterium]
MKDSVQERPETDAGPPLAVVLKGYPRLSETFIAQELKALQDRGFRFDIWSLRRPYDDRTHPIHDQIHARCAYLPEYLHEAPLRVLRGLARACRLPGFRRALTVFLRDLARDRTRNRIRRFGQAAVLAAELPGETRFLYVHFLHTPASTARYAGLMRGIAWGFSAHAKDIWTIPDWEKREKIAEARFGVTCTASGAAHLAGLAPDGRDGQARISLAYHGLDLSRFPPPPQRGARPGPLTILSVGRLVEKKGYDDLLAALALLPATLDWRLVQIGGGARAKALAAEAEARGLSRRIDWRGKRDQRDVIAAMREADFFVLPSKIARDGDRDGLPNVLMEAASQELPCISTAVSAIPEFLRDGQEGLLVPPSDPAALAAAILRLAEDPTLAATLGRASRQRLVAEFGMEAGITRIAELLTAGLGQAAPAESDASAAPTASAPIDGATSLARVP